MRTTIRRASASSVLAAVAGSALSACGGGAPLLHPAHVLAPGSVSFGAGASGRAIIRDRADTEDVAKVEEVAIAPGVAPWVSGRVGIRGSNEAGLTFTGRAVRADVRHAFGLGGPALSVGVGGSVLMAQRPGRGDGDPESFETDTEIYGGGFDVPVLFGARSRSDLYAIWIGPRFGVDVLGGGLRRPSPSDPGAPADFRDVDVIVLSPSFVLGMRAGFRHIHVAVELDAAYHRVDAQLEGRDFAIDQVSLTPGGALILTF